MDINSIKSEFKNYLVQNQVIEDPEVEISIFQYASEFNKFLDYKYHVNLPVVNITELDKLEIEGNTITFAEDEDTEEANAPIISYTSENEVPEDTFESSATVDTESEVAIEIPNTLDLINEFFSDENIKEFSDLDGNGELTEKEIKAVLKSISGRDGDINDISLEDLVALYKILYPSKDEDEKEDNDLNISNNNFNTQNNNLSSDNFISSKIQEENKSYPAGNVAQNSTGRYEANVSTSKQKELSTKNIDSMTYDELVDSQSVAQSDYINANKELTDIYNGNNAELLKKEAQVQLLYDTYEEELAKLDEEEATTLKQFKEDIDSKEKEIDAQKIQITNQKAVVRSTQSEYDQALQSRESIKSSISGLEASLSDASDEEAVIINKMISELKSQLESANKDIDTAKSKLEKAKEDLTKLNNDKIKLEVELNNLKTGKSEWEAQIAQKYPEIQEYMNQYNEAKSQYETDKDNAITSAKENVNNIGNHLAKIKNRISELETEDKKAEGFEKIYDELGLNNSEEDEDSNADYNKELANAILKAAKKYVNGNTKSKQQCAKGVREALEEAFGVGDYALFSGDAYEWEGYFNENTETWANITGDYKSASDLKNLPAGAIVVWSQYNGGPYGHICIADGKGGEYSDFYRSTIITSFADKGGTYQVFIPRAQK